MSLSDTWIETARATPIERVIDERGIRLRGRIERIGRCPMCGGTDRFSINTKKQCFNCRGYGGGDVIALVQHLDDCDFVTACTTLAGERPRNGVRHKPDPERKQRLREQREQDEAAARAEARRQCAKARTLWRMSKVAPGTPVETYLRERRKITSPLPATVRYLPPLKSDHHPAMIVPYGLPQEPEPGVLEIAESAIAAVQLTLLKADGSDKADVKPNKITIASPAGRPMVLAPVSDLFALVICEGVEDALSVHLATGLGAWAAGGGSFLPKLASIVPAYVKVVTIYAHDDDTGQRGALELADALVARNIEVFLEGLTP